MAARLFARRIDYLQRLPGWAMQGWRAYTGNTASSKPGVYAVDLRSDVVTQPSQAMKEAMMEGTMGDDVFGEDPTINS